MKYKNDVLKIENKEQINVEIQKCDKYNTVSRSLHYG